MKEGMNKDITIGELEKMRGELNTSIAEAIQKFESETGTRVGYIDTVRKRDHEEKGGGCCCEPMPYNEDRGDVVTVNVNMNMDF
jgi:hypothetical protein